MKMPRATRSLPALLALALAFSVAAGPVAGQPDSAPVTPMHPLEHRLLHGIEAGVARVKPWLERYGYGAVFVAVGVEGFGIPAPGQTVMEAASAAATSANGRLRIGWVLLSAFVATVLGTSLGYLIGRSGGRGLLRRLPLDPRHLERIEDQFRRYGGWFVLFARFLDGPRQLNGIAAGSLGMPWARFTLFNVVGAAIWVSFWGLGVYYLDLHLDQVVGLIRRVNPWAAAFTLAGLSILVLMALRGHARRGRSDG